MITLLALTDCLTQCEVTSHEVLPTSYWPGDMSLGVCFDLVDVGCPNPLCVASLLGQIVLG